MSEYNCKITRITPKDTVFERVLPPYGTLDGQAQLGYTKEVNGTCLCFKRVRRSPAHKWYPWMFCYYNSKENHTTFTFWTYPGLYKLAGLLHRKQT